MDGSEQTQRVYTFNYIYTPIIQLYILIKLNLLAKKEIEILRRSLTQNVQVHTRKIATRSKTNSISCILEKHCTFGKYFRPFRFHDRCHRKFKKKAKESLAKLFTG